jgi:hypothetical protein
LQKRRYARRRAYLNDPVEIADIDSEFKSRGRDDGAIRLGRKGRFSRAAFVRGVAPYGMVRD